ncbi:hypothetical protein JMJ55_04565 [Belnapia sp. T6]|uniref:UrcA family protein n=1 Tax=Belnapia mucosa TaxID=2804532 RepID=A0ABS1UYQ8_9PROT|nr:hypothetical protein [Belnapia mucosa]MBL6454586.1 hypothetical protein [Belnapia mucosa]
MRKVVLLLAAANLCGAAYQGAVAQDAVRFDRPIFTTEATVLCARQEQITMLRRAEDGGDRAGFERIATRDCKRVAPDLRLTVVGRQGLYDPDVEVRVASAPDLDPGVPRSRMWTLKSMVRN